jgi:FAD dependent oxidoreductase TIGR03364
MKGYDVAIIGSGIIGLAHAYAAAKRGLKTIVLERNSRPLGASVRNFGLQVPLAQLPGENYALAIKSQAIWKEVATEFSFWAKPNGLFILSLSELENVVMNEFVLQAEALGYNGIKFINKEELKLATSSRLNHNNIAGAIFSTNETTINPANALQKIAEGLKEKYKVDFKYNCTVQRINNNLIETNLGAFNAERIIVCTGASHEQFYPEAFTHLKLKKCKLQVMKLEITEPGWQLNEAIASGISMLHYSSFYCAPSIGKLKLFYETNYPELKKYGIHILAVENNNRELIIGDSHEYDEFDFDPGIKTEINDIILHWAGKYLNIQSYKVKETWSGEYLKNMSENIYCRLSPTNNIRIVNAVGGQGMTISFGLAEETFNQWN